MLNIAIKTEDDQLIGFLLATDPLQGDCLVTPLLRGAHIDTPLGTALISDGHLEAGELRFTHTAAELAVDEAPAPIRLEAHPDRTILGRVGPHAVRASWARRSS